MKKLTLYTLILIGIPLLGLSQSSPIQNSIYPIRDEAGKEYLMIPLERASIIDYWARRGVQGQSLVKETKQLIDQVKIAKISNDSFYTDMLLSTMSLKTKVREIGDENKELQIKFGKCENDFKQIELNLNKYKEENSKLKKKIFWNNFTIIGISVASVASITYLLTR